MFRSSPENSHAHAERQVRPLGFQEQGVCSHAEPAVGQTPWRRPFSSRVTGTTCHVYVFQGAVPRRSSIIQCLVLGSGYFCRKASGIMLRAVFWTDSLNADAEMERISFCVVVVPIDAVNRRSRKLRCCCPVSSRSSSLHIIPVCGRVIGYQGKQGCGLQLAACLRRIDLGVRFFSWFVGFLGPFWLYSNVGCSTGRTFCC